VPIFLRTGSQSIRFDLIFEANYIEAAEEDFYEVEISPEEEAKIKEIANDIAYLSSSQQESQKYPYRSPANWYLFYGPGQGNDAGNFYLCLCPDNNPDSCKQGACQQMVGFGENGIKLASNLQGQQLASKNAETLLIKKDDIDKTKFIISKE
jgi:hypothetical protein